MTKIDFTDGELYEIGDAIAAALDALLAQGDPENYEAKYGSASNMLSVTRKVSDARWPGNPPEWLPELEARVAQLRSRKVADAGAAAAVETMKIFEAGMKPLFSPDAKADSDGIRVFDLTKGK